jgi:two-component system response regulator ResD
VDTPEPTRGSILVVDDEPTIAEVVARYLVRAGYETRTAGDGPSAVAAATTRRPDLVVLDIRLPGIDGLEVMRRLHEDAEERVPVILLTAKGEESDRLVGLRQGADDYVVKPFSPLELVARVDAILRRTEGSRSTRGRGGSPSAGGRSSSRRANSTFSTSWPGIRTRCSAATS